MAELDCQDFVELVTAYVDGALDPETRARFERHVDECEGCAVYLAQIRETIALLGSLSEPGLSDDAVSRLWAAFRSWTG